MLGLPGARDTHPAGQVAAGAFACLPRGASRQALILAAVSATRGRRLIGGSAVFEMIKLAEAGRVNREIIPNLDAVRAATAGPAKAGRPEL
ncbi:MAG: hypothetical protein ACTHQQ_10105 [Solirubrobacteraceae bacterium]